MTDLHARRTAARLVDPVVLVLLVFSLGLNVFLALRLNSLGATPREHDRLAIGTVVPSIRAADASGALATIRLDAADRPTVVFIYSPTCQWCEKTWPVFAGIARARQNTHRFLALSVAERGQFLDAHREVRLLLNPSRETVEQLKLGTVPTTIVFDRRGRVEQVWVGAYAGGTRTSISRYFSLAEEALASE